MARRRTTDRFPGQGPERWHAQQYEESLDLYMIDRRTGAAERVYVDPGGSIDTPAITRDNGRVYFSLTAVEANIWALRLNER